MSQVNGRVLSPLELAAAAFAPPGTMFVRPLVIGLLHIRFGAEVQPAGPPGTPHHVANGLNFIRQLRDLDFKLLLIRDSVV